MANYEIVVAERVIRTYFVTADDEEQAKEKFVNGEAYDSEENDVSHDEILEIEEI